MRTFSSIQYLDLTSWQSFGIIEEDHDKEKKFLEAHLASHCCGRALVDGHKGGCKLVGLRVAVVMDEQNEDRSYDALVSFSRIHPLKYLLLDASK